MEKISKIKERIDNHRLRLYLWARGKADSKEAKTWLIALGFSEASFFLIPPDVMLVAVLLLGARRWWYWAGLTTASSVLGGFFGYLIGFAFFDLFGEAIVSAYALHDEIALVGEWYQNNAFWAVFTSALTPIPYKVFTISAGLFHINLIAFLAASILGRGIRFYGVAYITARFGKPALRLVKRYFNTISLIIVALIVLYVVLF